MEDGERKGAADRDEERTSEQGDEERSGGEKQRIRISAILGYTANARLSSLQ